MIHRPARLCIAAVVIAAFSSDTVSLQAAEPEVLQYRHAAGANLHFKDEQAVRDCAQRLRTLGCEYTLKNHLGHYDLAYRCPEWRQITGTHEELCTWASFLASLAFETSHRYERTFSP